MKMPRKGLHRVFLQCVKRETVLDVIMCGVGAWKLCLYLFSDGKFLVLVTKKNLPKPGVLMC